MTVVTSGRIPKFRRRSKPEIERFWAKVVGTEDPTGCWTWTAGKLARGYGQFACKGFPTKTVGAHRWSYRELVGPVPDGYELDHLCRNTACVNPAHLEPVTAKENVLRGMGRSAVNARKTHCHRGHPLSGDNLSITRVGTRLCRRCHCLSQRQYLERHGLH